MIIITSLSAAALVLALILATNSINDLKRINNDQPYR